MRYSVLPNEWKAFTLKIKLYSTLLETLFGGAFIFILLHPHLYGSNVFRSLAVKSAPVYLPPAASNKVLTNCVQSITLNERGLHLGVMHGSF